MSKLFWVILIIIWSGCDVFMHRRKQTEQKMMSERHVFSHILAAILIYFLIWLTKYFLVVNYGFERWVSQFCFARSHVQNWKHNSILLFLSISCCLFLCFFTVYSHFSSRKLFPNKMLTTFLDLLYVKTLTLLDVKLTCFQTCFLFHDKHLWMCLWK